MTEEQHTDPEAAPPENPSPPETPPRPMKATDVIPKSFIYGVVAIVIGSFALTLFIRNPYTQSVSEGSLYYERSTDTNMILWVAIFIGIPASFWAYKKWILPLFERK